MTYKVSKCTIIALLFFVGFNWYPCPFIMAEEFQLTSLQIIILWSEFQLKLRMYEARCSAEAITFLPLAVDTLGGWHKVGLKTITRLGRQLARNLGKDEDEVVRHLRQRLGVLIARDNAAMMASRHPTFAPPEVDGDPD